MSEDGGVRIKERCGTEGGGGTREVGLLQVPLLLDLLAQDMAACKAFER